MSISDSVIQGAVTRYYREYDRYLKLCVRVAEICRLEIVEGNAIRAQVTSRAKSPKSLEGKLRRFAVSGKKEFPDIDSVFDQIRDLAAVRIATYEQKHEKQIAEEVCKRFAGHDGENATLEVKDRHAEIHLIFIGRHTAKCSCQPLNLLEPTSTSVVSRVKFRCAA